jgi:hypothetical protein
MRLKPELFIPELQSVEMDGADYIPWKSELQSLSGAAKARIRISRLWRESHAFAFQGDEKKCSRARSPQTVEPALLRRPSAQ